MQTLMNEVAIIKLTELANKKWFDICVLNTLLVMLGGGLTPDEAKLLGHVHCVDYDKLSMQAKQELGEYIRTILGRYITNAPIPEFTQLMLTK